jgi:hypothetical protein
MPLLLHSSWASCDVFLPMHHRRWLPELMDREQEPTGIFPQNASWSARSPRASRPRSAEPSSLLASKLFASPAPSLNVLTVRLMSGQWVSYSSSASMASVRLATTSLRRCLSSFLSNSQCYAVLMPGHPAATNHPAGTRCGVPRQSQGPRRGQGSLPSPPLFSPPCTSRPSPCPPPPQRSLVTLHLTPNPPLVRTCSSSSSCQAFIRRCLTYDVGLRPDVLTLCRDPYLAKK